MNTMNLPDRYRDESWAKELFDKSEYVCVAVNGENGTPYNIPLCVVRMDNALYFHTALKGTMLDLIRKDGRACITCTTYTKRDPQHTTLLFQSAVAMGTISEITEPTEKESIMLRFFAKYLPGDLKAEAYAKRASIRASVWRFDIEEISGKENQ